MPPETARDIALRALIDYEKRDAFLSALLAARLERSGLDRRDKAFVTELTLGTVRMKLTLDWFLKGFSNQPVDRLEPEVGWGLRLGAYQVLFTAVPDYAAVNMTVESTASVSGRGRGGYVNAVLRALVGGHENVAFPDSETDPAAYLEVKYSHPRWVVEMWTEELGFAEAENICAADNVQPSLSARTNLCRISRDELSARLASSGIEVSEGRMAPECLLLRGSGPVGDLQEFERGLFSVQDQAAQLVGLQVAPEKGMRVLDMCAAPGGKANHLAEQTCNSGTVLAVDINSRRLAMVAEAAARLGNTSVSVLQADATCLSSAFPSPAEDDGGFDRVLLDAPCTGLGTLSRRPDARWRKSPDDIEGLVELQGALIDEAGRMVRPGGRLVYSTCTISKRENQAVVDSFVERAAGFRTLPVRAEGAGMSPYCQIMPRAGECDGMFVAVLERDG